MGAGFNRAPAQPEAAGLAAGRVGDYICDVSAGEYPGTALEDFKDAERAILAVKAFCVLR